MHSLCSKSSLCVSDEKELVTLFTKYLEHREALRPLLPEEDPWRDWSHLTDEEKEKRTLAKEEEEKKATTAKEEEEKTKQAAYDVLEPLGKANKKWEYEVDAVHK